MDKLRVGTFAIIVPYKLFRIFLEKGRKDELCKITDKNSMQYELAVMKKIYDIPNCLDYYTNINIDSVKNININSQFISHLLKMDNEEVTRFIYNNTNLCYFFMKNEGAEDLHDIMNVIEEGGNHPFLINPEEKFTEFVTQIIEAVFYLHENKMAHLDIKPENIIYNSNEKSFKKRWKLIDFGLSDYYPFDRYLKKGPYGTPCYTPIELNENSNIYKNYSPIKYLPLVSCNDWIYTNQGYIHYEKYYNGKNINYTNIYKTDVYGLGITIKGIYQCLLNCNRILQWSSDTTKRNLFHTNTEELIRCMTHSDINCRLTIKEVMKLPFFKANKRTKSSGGICNKIMNFIC